MLQGIGGEHELMDGDVVYGEELFTGEMTIFVDGETLASNNDNTGMFGKEIDLFLKTTRKRNVIGVHAGNKMTFGLGKAEIEGIGDSEVGLVTIYLETGVYSGIVFENLVRIVC